MRLPLSVVCVACISFAIHNASYAWAQPKPSVNNPSEGRQRENPPPNKGRASPNTNPSQGQGSSQQKNKPLPMPPKSTQSQMNKPNREPQPSPPFGQDNGPRPQTPQNVGKMPGKKHDENMPFSHTKSNGPVHPVISLNDAKEISQKVHEILEESVKSHVPSPTHITHSIPHAQKRQDLPPNIEPQKIEPREELKSTKSHAAPEPVIKELSPTRPASSEVTRVSEYIPPPPQSPLPIVPPPPLNNVDHQIMPIPDHTQSQPLPFPTNIRDSPVHMPNSFQDPSPPVFSENHMKSQMKFEQFKDSEQEQYVPNDNVPSDNFLESSNLPMNSYADADVADEPKLTEVEGDVNSDDVQEANVDIHMEATNQINDPENGSGKKDKSNPGIPDLPPYKFQVKKPKIQHNPYEADNDTTFSKSQKGICVHGLLNIGMILLLYNI